MLKRLKGLSLILLLVVLLVLAIITLSLIPGKRPGRSLLSEMFDRRPPKVLVSELYFEIGRNRIFAYSLGDGAVAAAGTLGLQVLGPDGNELLADSYRMETPALTENNGRFIAFDIGGTAVRVFSAFEVLSSIETSAPIVSASLNKNGWFCVVTQEQRGGSRGTVSVYDPAGTMVLQATVFSSYVLAAGLSDDNTILAILGIAQTGSRILVFDGIDETKDDPDRVIELGSGVFLDIDFIESTKVLTIGEHSAAIVDLAENGETELLHHFGESRLGSYTYSDEFIALHLYDYSIGYSGLMLTFDYSGELLGQFDTAREITSIASEGGSLVILNVTGVTFFDKELNTYPPSGNNAAAATAGKVIALGEDMALAANDVTALVIRREE